MVQKQGSARDGKRMRKTAGNRSENLKILLLFVNAKERL
jgi:hypothetical protein